MTAEGARVPLAGGLSGVEVPAAAAARARPQVLLLHGMMAGAWQFERFQDSLARAGYRSLALDYRGHNRSAPVKRLGRLSVRDYMEDALAGCGHLGGRPVVVGQSMGGLIALMLAARDAVRAAVLVCALPPRGIRWRTARSPRASLRHLPAILRGRPLDPDREELDDLIFNAIPPAERPEFFARQVQESSRVAGEIAFGRIAVDPSRVGCPVLSVSASDDRLVLPEVGEEIARRYGADHLRLEGCGHYALVGEPQWRDAACRITDWLGERD